MIRTLCLSMAALAVLSAGAASAHRARSAVRQAPAAAAAQPAAPSVPAQTAAPQPPIGYAQAVILIRAALTSVEQANEASDYNVMYALGSKGFQRANPPARLAQTFAPLKAYNLNGVLALEPQFTQQPVLTADGMMAMAGYFTNGAYRINFQLAYTPEDKHWKLFGISAGVQPIAAH